MTAKPAQAMLLYEAALQAGICGTTVPALGRPACAALPLTQNTNSVTFSLGCKGNRTFTGLPDDEMYLCIPGTKGALLVEKYGQIQQANAAMEAHYVAHKSRFPDTKSADPTFHERNL